MKKNPGRTTFLMESIQIRTVRVWGSDHKDRRLMRPYESQGSFLCFLFVCLFVCLFVFSTFLHLPCPVSGKPFLTYENGGYSLE